MGKAFTGMPRTAADKEEVDMEADSALMLRMSVRQSYVQAVFCRPVISTFYGGFQQGEGPEAYHSPTFVTSLTREVEGSRTCT